MMSRCLALACMAGLATILGCDLPAPAQYNHAMLREYFGKSPKKVEGTFGKRKSILRCGSQFPPENATTEERKQFNKNTESMDYRYSTPDGNLVFHFNLNGKVYAITYAGRDVKPAAQPIPTSAKSPSS